MNKIALVTGGSGGIGSAICQDFSKKGYKVIATAIPGKGKNWLKEQQEQGFNFNMVNVDVADYNSCKKMAAEVREKFGSPDIIVNNAGITRDAPFKRMTLEQWNEVIRTNLDSVFNVTHQFINDLLKKGWGRIINISSINGQKGQFGQTNYAAAKAGLHGFTMSLAQETARAGITVNTISPGYTATPMVTQIREDILNKIIAQIPMQRLAKTTEIAAITSFLASDEAAFISGANVPINGAQFTSF